MNQRAHIVMTEDEITAFIEGSRKLQLGTVNWAHRKLATAA
ncbi:hypothetical protein [Streptosporangium sp. NPDC087985]